MELKSDFLGEKSLSNKKTGVYDDQINGFKYENGGDKSDCYIVDLENFSGIHQQHSTTTNSSRITLQRSLSRKVPQRGAERKLNDRDTLAPASSPRAVQVASMAEKSPSPTQPIGSQDHAANHQQQQQQPQHQITIKTGSMNAMADGRMGKRSSFKRSSYSWYSDPKRILLFFATLSSMGTMLLIYFTLSSSKVKGVEGVIDWQQ